MLEWGATSAKFGVAVLKASASRSATFGVVVFKTCMLDWGDRSASTSTKFGVAILKASVLNLGEGRSASTSAKFV